MFSWKSRIYKVYTFRKKRTGSKLIKHSSLPSPKILKSRDIWWILSGRCKREENGSLTSNKFRDSSPMCHIRSNHAACAWVTVKARKISSSAQENTHKRKKKNSSRKSLTSASTVSNYVNWMIKSTATTSRNEVKVFRCLFIWVRALWIFKRMAFERWIIGT